MGLDMYAWAVKFIDGHEEPEVDADLDHDADHIESFDLDLWYWSKHPNLHGWMRQLYRDKGGESEDFNCCNVELTEGNLQSLETDINDGSLPYTQGFFFGESSGDDDEKQGDLQFIAKAREAIKDGYHIYYSAWF